MPTPIHLTGQLPEHWQEGLELLAGDLSMVPAAQGLEITCTQGDALSVTCDGTAISLTWAQPVQFYRALSLIPQPLAPCAIREKPCFSSAGVMFDCSRNAVLRPEALRFFLRKMALMGLNLGMLYTEDTYEVPEQPFFGYKRGRYTYEELKSLDDYAHILGISLCPCIQALGHLKRALHWPAFRHLRDNEEVLLADEEETYLLLEQMIRAASAPYRSKKIHLGMDEAFGVGLGEHLRRFGYEDPHQVMGRHLSRVLDITGRLGLEAMIWSDMYFHLDGRDYHSPGAPSQRAREAVDPRVTLVYWDYYQNREEKYAAALARHACFPAPTVFAGGLWTWIGPAPSYANAFENTVPALEACRKAAVPLVVATAWGDNGAETNLLAALLAIQLYGEITYTGGYDRAALFRRFRRCCGGDPQAFWDLDRFNRLPGMAALPGDPPNLCKILLYQDPLIQLFEADTAGLPLAEHFSGLETLYTRYAGENPGYQGLFSFYAALARALTLKCRWHEGAAEAVRQKDRAKAAALAGDLPQTMAAMEELRLRWRELWESTNKPQGFEVIDLRLGGVIARLSTARSKMLAFARGAVEDIPELSEPSLICKRRADGGISCTNTMDEIATPSRIDY